MLLPVGAYIRMEHSTCRYPVLRNMIKKGTITVTNLNIRKIESRLEEKKKDEKRRLLNSTAFITTSTAFKLPSEHNIFTVTGYIIMYS